MTAWDITASVAAMVTCIPLWVCYLSLVAVAGDPNTREPVVTTQHGSIMGVRRTVNYSIGQGGFTNSTCIYSEAIKAPGSIRGLLCTSLHHEPLFRVLVHLCFYEIHNDNLGVETCILDRECNRHFSISQYIFKIP